MWLEDLLLAGWPPRHTRQSTQCYWLLSKDCQSDISITFNRGVQVEYGKGAFNRLSSFSSFYLSVHARSLQLTRWLILTSLLSLSPCLSIAVCLCVCLSHRSALANFGLPMLKGRRERGWLGTFSLKLLETLIINCTTSSHMRELSSMVFEQHKPYQNPKYNTARTKKTLIPYGIIAHWI